MSRLLLSVVLTLTGAVHVMHAAPFSAIVAYGDSLSDNGNVYNLLGYPPSPPYAQRFSNGYVAVELMAMSLGVPLTDFAWGGATTGAGNIYDGGNVATFNILPGMRTAYDFTIGNPALDIANSLFVVWGGPNDFRSPDPADSYPFGVATRAVDNLMYIVEGLQSAGAKHILVPGMGDLGRTPLFNELGPIFSGLATTVTVAFNAALQSRLDLLPTPVTYVDTFGMFDYVVNNPAEFGFTNVTDACVQGDTVCDNPEGYLFWDDVHVTAGGHYLLGTAFTAAVTHTPEPSAALLIASGAVLLAAVRRRHKKSTLGI